MFACFLADGRLLHVGQWLKCKIKGGGRYVQVWAPDNGRVPFPSIVTI